MLCCKWNKSFSSALVKHITILDYIIRKPFSEDLGMERAGQLRVLAARAEDPDSVPSTHTGSSRLLATAAPRNPMPF